MKMTKRWTGTWVVAFVGASALAVNAAQINYGTFLGTDVSYIGVTESSGTDGLPLYNAPSVIGNSLDFDPTSFVSFANGGSADVTDGQLNFTIQANQGKGITSLSISEFGDYTLAGIGNAATSASVGQVFFIKVLEIDHVALTPSQVASLTFTANAAFAPSGGTFNLQDEGTTSAAPWTGSFNFDVAAAIAGSGLGQLATRISVVSNNTLVTTSQAGTVAFIAKKDVVFDVTSIPEPASLGLLGGIALLAMRRRRPTA